MEKIKEELYLTKDEAIERLKMGFCIGIVLEDGEALTAYDYIVTGTGFIQWITVVHNKFIPDCVVKSYYK